MRPSRTMIALVAMSALMPDGGLGCSSAVDEVVLFLDTDAPVATHDAFDSRKATEEGIPTPLFDRVGIAVIHPVCAGCDRTFAIDSDAFRERRVSVGIPFPKGVTYVVVRATLFRSAGEGAPRPTSSFVRHVRLARPQGRADHTVSFGMDSYPAPKDEDGDHPGVADDGPPVSSRVGTWVPAARAACHSAAAHAGAVCVPGGAYFMHRSEQNPVDETLVTLSPFWMDRDEVAVSRLRRGSGKWTTPADTSGFSSALFYCTTDPSLPLPPAAVLDFPANCMTSVDARAFCEDAGGTLPTVAQFEYAMRGLGASRLPWGSDARPSCEDAIVGRRTDETANQDSTLPPTLSECCAIDPVRFPYGPAPIGSSPARKVGMRDALVLAEGERIFDLVGNMSEWTLDDEWIVGARENQGGCPPAPGVLHDPRCQVVPPVHRAARGGCFAEPRWPGEVAPTRPFSGIDADYFIGFRCVYRD